jgi:hypothetical protein
MATTPAVPTAGARGPLGTPTNIGMQILLTIVTLGIWALVWTYRQYKQFKDYSGEGLGGGLGLILAIVIGVVTFFLIPMEIENNLYKKDGLESPVSPLVGLWFLLPIVGGIIWYVKVQHAINDFWASKGVTV